MNHNPKLTISGQFCLFKYWPMSHIHSFPVFFLIISKSNNPSVAVPTSRKSFKYNSHSFKLKSPPLLLIHFVATVSAFIYPYLLICSVKFCSEAIATFWKLCNCPGIYKYQKNKSGIRAELRDRYSATLQFLYSVPCYTIVFSSMRVERKRWRHACS